MTIQRIAETAVKADEQGYGPEGGKWGSLYVRDVPPLLNIVWAAQGLIEMWDESGDEYPDIDRVSAHVMYIKRAITKLEEAEAARTADERAYQEYLSGIVPGNERR